MARGIVFIHVAQFRHAIDRFKIPSRALTEIGRRIEL